MRLPNRAKILFSEALSAFSRTVRLIQKTVSLYWEIVTKPIRVSNNSAEQSAVPLKKDFAHFFISYERTNIDQGVIIDIPSRPTLNASTSTPLRANNILLRGDMQPSEKHQLSIHYLREDSPQFNQIIPVGTLTSTLAASREEADVDQTMVGSYTYNIASNLLNDLRLSFTQEDVLFASPGFTASKSQAELPPTLQFSTFVDQQSNVSQARINNSYRLADTLTWIRGSHTFKFGVDYN